MIKKLLFDYICAVIILCSIGWILLIIIIISAIDTKSSGIFSQKRVGKMGQLFNCLKIQTMKKHNSKNTITILNDERVTKWGKFLRKYKLDELPQLINILRGEMSFVGPRPDVPGYADLLEGEDRIILTVKPGITSPATLKYRNEETLLAQISNPIEYNDQVIWPDKVVLNKVYVQNWSFTNDLKILYQTIFIK